MSQSVCRVVDGTGPERKDRTERGSDEERVAQIKGSFIFISANVDRIFPNWHGNAV